MPSDRRSSSAGSGHSSRSRAERASGSMGPDGGEAGRRIAAEDEYIRQELSEATSFCNAFWGHNDAGFDSISARMKASQRTLDELKSLYKERADIEADYAKRLAKLARQPLGHSDTGALKAAFDVVKLELDATSRTHSDLANMIKKDLEAAVVDFANRTWNARKAAQANIEKLHKHKQTQEAYVNKSREKYEQDCIKINGYTAQSSLVQGKDLDKVAYKLDKAQATVSQNDKDYQNFVRALKDTTLKWHAEWKAYLDQCQDQEEERIDFTKSNLWNFANAVSAVCVADDESCERIRVSLENVDTPRDVQFFIQHAGTGSLIPAPPEYINYAKGQAPPARPVYHTARFQRNTTRPTQLPIPQQPPQSQQPSPSAGVQPLQSHNSSQAPSPQPPQPAAQPVVAQRNAQPFQEKPVPPQPATQSFDSPQRQFEPDHRQQTSALPSADSASAPYATQVSLDPDLGHGHSPSRPVDTQRRMSAKNFLARTPSLSQSKSPKSQSSSRPAPPAALGGATSSNHQQPAAASASNADDDDPIAKALASLRMRPGGKSPGLGRRDSLSAEQKPPAPFAQPGQIVHNMPPEHRAHSPSQSMATNVPPRARSPSAAFMQAPARAASPLPVEEVVGQYGQSFPGERKSLSRQNSVASRAGAPASEAPRSPSKHQQDQGFAGVGARGRSPSPQPWSRPTQQQQQLQHHQQQQHAAQSPRAPAPSSDQPKSGTLSRRQSNVPPRSTTPLGIALDATGSVTHDQMAVDYMRRAGSVPPQQHPQPQQPPPPQAAAVPPAHAQQPARPPSVVHANYQPAAPHHQAHASVSSQYSMAPGATSAPAIQSPYAYQGQHGAQPSMYSAVGQSTPQMPTQAAPQQYPGYAAAGYGHQPAASQSVPAHLAHQQGGSQYSTSPAPAQAAYAQQAPVQQAAGHYQYPGGVQGQYAGGQETAASAYMHEYLQQQAPAHANGVAHGHQPSMSQGQHYQQWNRATSPAPAPAPAPVQQAPAPAHVPAPGGAQPQGHAPTGQYSDAGQPILFYVKALYDYQATNPDEFSFTTGDIIAVTHTEADGWWQGELLDEARRKAGANTFPSNFVALLM